MARYSGPVCRLCRREGMKLFLKGERCHTEKCAIEKRNFAPGQHGKDKKAQARRLRPAASRKAEGPPLLSDSRRAVPEPLRKGRESKRYYRRTHALVMLERRLDNVVYRMGLATSRAQGRQLVRHGTSHRERQEGQYSFLYREAGRFGRNSRKQPEQFLHLGRARRYGACAEPVLAGSGSRRAYAGGCCSSPSVKSWCRFN